MALALSAEQALALLRGAAVDLVRADACDLTQRQLAVMLLVYLGTGARTVRDLAAELAIGKPAVSRALDKLERHGLVRRMADTRDRRSIVVGRTVAGSAYLRELSDRMVGAAAASS